MNTLIIERDHTPIIIKRKISEEKWSDLCQMMGELYRFSSSDIKNLERNKMMKLIAAIPYLAGCRNPERVAASHLSITIMAASPAGKKTGSHCFSDNTDLMERLERISHFPGGNKIIIDRGMKLLALIMVNDHILDAQKDKERGKYNPVNNGIWNGKKIKEDLVKELNSFSCPQMDDIMPVYEAEKANWLDYSGWRWLV